MALRRSAGHAGEESPGSALGGLADRAGARPRDQCSCQPALVRTKKSARTDVALLRSGSSYWIWLLSTDPLTASEVGGHASRFLRSDFVVVYDGFSPWCRVDAGSDPAHLD